MLIHQAYKKGETSALEIIEQFDIASPPVPVEKIARKLGLSITEYDFDDGISGALVISKGFGSIGVNKKDQPTRKRFTIAHELGHYIMHKDTNKVFLDKDFLVKWRNSNNAYTLEERQQELEANAFAAALLMPKKLIETEVRKIEAMNLDEIKFFNHLSSIFHVSVPAISFRITNLNAYFF